MLHNITGAAAQYIDFAVDIEIDGTSVTQKTATIASSGDNTVHTTTATKRAKIYRLSIMPSADVTGTITFKVGSTELYQVVDAKEGGDYGFNLTPNFHLGATGENVVVNLPGASSTEANLCVEEVD